MLAHHRLIALSLLFAGACMSAEAIAQDIFVKPTQQQAHPADLGIGVKPSQQQPAQHPVQQQAQQPVQQPVQHAPVQPTQMQPTQAPVQRPIGQPVVQPVQQPVLQPEQQIPQPQIIGRGEELQIIPMPQQPVAISPGSGANTFSIIIQPPAFGQTEVNEIYRALGLNSQEILKNCTYENMVVISSGDTGSAISMGQMNSAQQRFNGNLTSIDVFPTIACKKIRQPVSGIVIDQAGFYKIGATNVTCPPPRIGSINLSFKYLGNGKGDCQYR